MDEEEIVDKIILLLQCYIELKEDSEQGHASAYEMQFTDFEAIQGLLKLYNRKKEYIKENEIYRKNLFETYEEVEKLYNNLKEIEEEHRKENGELRVELKEAKEKNENLSCDRILIQENVYKEIKEKIENINNYINKNKLFELLEIDNIDVIHCRLKQILEE